MKTGKNGKHWQIIALVMIIGLSLFACDNGLNGGSNSSGGGAPLFDDLIKFFTAIVDNKGNFTVNITEDFGYDLKDTYEIKVDGENSYEYGEGFNSGGFSYWWEKYRKIDGQQWSRDGTPDHVEKKTGDFEKDPDEYYENLLLEMFPGQIDVLANFADEGKFTKNGNVYTLNDDNFDIALFKITISPESVSIDLELNFGIIYTFNFTNFTSTSVVLPPELLE